MGKASNRHVVSPRHAHALGTLVDSELFSEINEWPYESLDSAVTAVTRKSGGDAA
jgi:hypothetical protein